MDVIKKTNISIAYRLAFSCGKQVSSLVFGIILARLLSPFEFGVVAIANMVVFYANNFSNFGLNNALVQRKNINNCHLNTVFTINIFISIILAIVTFYSANAISLFFNNAEIAPILRWMSCYYIVTTFYYIPVVLLRRKIEFKFLSVYEFLESVATSISSVILAVNGFSYWSVVIPAVVVPFFSSIILALKTGWRPRFTIASDMNEIYSFGFWVFIRNQMELLVSKVDYFVVGRYLDLSLLGFYEKSFELTDRAMSGVTRPLNSVFYSAFCRLNGDMLHVKNVFLEGTSILGLVCYPLLLGLVGVAPHFVYSCLGIQWGDAVLPMQLLAIACLFRVLFGLVASVNVAIGLHKIHTFTTIISAGVFVVMCLFSVKYGIVAVCFAFIVYCIISFVFSFMLLYMNLNITIFDLFKSIWCPLVGALLMLLVVFLSQSYLLTNTESFLQLLLLISVGATVYSSWAYFFYTKGIIIIRISSLRPNVD